MLAILTDAPFDDPGWVFESKWDGFRMVAGTSARAIDRWRRRWKE
jgi:bifunctional non-homologous end joining protein LigD